MRFETLEIEEIKVITPKLNADNRGYFAETFKQEWFETNIANVKFVQDNQSMSKEMGTIRGLHYQKSPHGQGKLVRVLSGRIFDVAVDIRPNSKTFGKWVSIELSANNQKQIWVPDGFLHGFCTLEPETIVYYKTTAPYNAQSDAGIAFDDKDIGIKWPIDISSAIVSDRDLNQPSLNSLR